MVTLSRLPVSPAAADKLETRQQKKGGKKCPVLVQKLVEVFQPGTWQMTRIPWASFPERGWGEGRDLLHSWCCLPQTGEKTIKAFRSKDNPHSQMWMERGPPGQSHLDKGGGDRQDAFVFGRGLCCCCSLSSCKSFGYWMLHGSFSGLLLITSCDLDLIECVLSLQREGSALEEQWKCFSRLLVWSWLPKKADVVLCASVTYCDQNTAVLEWALLVQKNIIRLGKLEFWLFFFFPQSSFHLPNPWILHILASYLLKLPLSNKITINFKGSELQDDNFLQE